MDTPRLFRLQAEDQLLPWSARVCDDLEARLRALLNHLAPVLTLYTATVTCTGAMTAAGGTCVTSYSCVGNMVTLGVQIDGMTLGGTAGAQVRLSLPFPAAAMGITPAIITRYVVAGTYYTGSIVIAPSEAYAQLRAANDGNWALGDMWVYTQITYWK